MVERVGDYAIEAELGRGGMGVVYRARRPDGAPVALKVLIPGVLEPEDLARFEREARILERLDHPGIVRVLDAGFTPGGQPFLALELCGGGSLQARLHDGPLPVEEAVAVARELADALAYAQGQGVLHRDLKPHNVLFRDDGRPVITDFGLARMLRRDERLTVTGDVLGTPAYMAPEQTEGEREAVGAPSDVYGLGATLFAMLCGRPPFEGSSALQVLNKTLRERPPRPRALRPEVDPPLEAIVLRCLEKDPDARYLDAQRLLDALRARGSKPRAPAQLPWTVGALALGGLLVLGSVRLREPPTDAAPPPSASAPSAAPPSAAPPPETAATTSPRPDPELTVPLPRNAAPYDAPTPSQVQRLIDEAERLTWRGQLRAALDTATQAVARFPHWTTMLKRATALHCLRAYAQSLRDVDWIIARYPRCAQAHAQRGSELGRLGRRGEARQVLDQALALAPDDPQVLSTVGWGYWEILLDAAGAEFLWRRSLAELENGPALAGLAFVAYKIEKNPRRSLELAEKALRLAPRLALAMEARAAALLLLNRNAEAREAFAALRARAPTNLDFRQGLLVATWNVGGREEAWAMLEELLARISPQTHPERWRRVQGIRRAFAKALRRE